ncbi:MAG: Rne/Rng family ribonuclease [Bacteroidota bacterium]|nr:Rne/Rng family ribonuclease [Bacteroidota bacterium]
MNNELIIDSSDSEVVVALLEEKRLVELSKEKNNKDFAVGDIYLGRVRKIIHGLNAAFIDVGYEKDAFLHYLDLGPQINSLVKHTKFVMANKQVKLDSEQFVLEPNIEKTGKISNVLSTNQTILVQIAKEPISTKGPRLSSEISIAGRYLVLVPFSERVSVSQKIKNIEERQRLKQIVSNIKPINFGVIIRTVAENKEVSDIENDLKDLMSKWKECTKRLRNAEPPKKILGELDRTSAILRDHLNSTFNSIYVNDIKLFEEIKLYISTIAPEKVEIVKLFKGKEPIFEYFGVDKQIKHAFGKTVSLKNGAYLIIEHTEAMHVIDVNSGHSTKSDNNQESNAVDTNMEAASEIARQLRLRDMGGIIVVDFIDMTQSANRRLLYEKIKEDMKSDKARHSIIPPSKFGLVQITRQRVRPEMNIDTVEKCPACNGSGEIKSSQIFYYELENKIKFLLREQNEKDLLLTISPYIYSYLTKGIFSIQMKWYFKYKKWIKIRPEYSYHILEYHFYNKTEEIFI